VRYLLQEPFARHDEMSFMTAGTMRIRLATDEFRRELAGVARGLRRARVGAIGARPNTFNTTRYSEKLLGASSISVSTLDLSEVLDGARRLDDKDGRVERKLADITGYAAAPRVPNAALTPMAKFGVIVSEWMTALDLDATAVQCWSSLQKNYGVNCCTIMR
jgi:L-fucose isomerase-like protein